MSERVVVTGRNRDLVIFLDKLILALSRHWLLAFNTFWGIYLGLAILAPVLMAAGFTAVSEDIYRFFAPQCHQLPQRSYYLLGQAGGIQTYSLDQVLAWGASPDNLRTFVGNPEIGFKMAIAHRLTAIHTALFVGGLLWGGVIGKRLPRLSFWVYGLLILPMILDGGSHNVDAVVLFGSMGADAVDNLSVVQQHWGGGAAIIEQYGLPTEAPEVWAKLSPITYLADVSTPISIHHGNLDEEVPPELSARLWQAMQAANLPGEYYTYPNQGHFFTGKAWRLAMGRTLAFFDKYVKEGYQLKPRQ